MKDSLKKVMKILSTATSRDDFPLYCQYLRSKDGYLSTCNDEAFITIKYPIGFEGTVNYFVLLNTLSSLNDPAFSTDVDKLQIKEGNFRSIINMMTMNFPQVNLFAKETKFIPTDYTRLPVLKAAIQFTGPSDKYSYVYMTNGAIMSTNGVCLFHHRPDSSSLKEDLLEKTILIDKRVLSVLDDNMSVGTNANGNTLVNMKFGYALFIVHNLDVSFLQLLNGTYNQSITDMQELCSFGELSTGLKKLVPVLFNEEEKLFQLTNKNGKLSVVAESMVDGKSKITLDSKIKEEFEILLNYTHLMHIPDIYDVYVGRSFDRLIFRCNNSSIVVKVK